MCHAMHSVFIVFFVCYIFECTGVDVMEEVKAQFSAGDGTRLAELDTSVRQENRTRNCVWGLPL